MPTEARPLARQLLRVVLGTPDVPDSDLLARFVKSRDEESFAEIVRRHGAMVLAVCRRVTGRPHDADDAFQAAFLVLARRASHISRPELLANWLYGVACRTALEARAARQRYEAHVVLAPPEPTAPTPPDDTAELRRVIDEELAKLPDKYRSAVVLCDLEGLPRAAAAARLGIPEGTLSSRLAHARKVLAERLSRRGVTAGSAAIAAALSRDALVAAVPHNLTHTIVLAAVRFAPGVPSPPGVSPAVSSLTDGVLKTMLATRLRQLFAVGLLACGLIGIGTVLAQQPRAATTDPTVPPVAGYVVTPDGVLALQQKIPEQKKVAAKGIEDDDVPYGSFPAQAVVRIEDGKLIVRQRGYRYEPTRHTTADGTTVTAYERKSGVTATTHDPADVSVFDIKGNRLAAKDWKAQLKADVHALVSTDGKLPHPRELALFKADTLLLVLPAPAVPAGQYSVPLPATPPAVRPATAAPAAPALPSQNSRPAPAPGAYIPAAPVIPPADIAENVRGTVMRNPTDGLVQISIGRDAGLEVNSKLDIHRGTGGGMYLGTLTVTKVLPKEAACEFKPARPVAFDKLRDEELPRKGDTVSRITTRSAAP